MPSNKRLIIGIIVIAAVAVLTYIFGSGDAPVANIFNKGTSNEEVSGYCCAMAKTQDDSHFYLAACSEMYKSYCEKIDDDLPEGTTMVRGPSHIKSLTTCKQYCLGVQ